MVEKLEQFWGNIIILNVIKHLSANLILNLSVQRSIYFEEGDHVAPESVSASATGHDVTEFRMSSGILESVLKAPPAAVSAASRITTGNKSHVLRYGGRPTTGDR